MRQVSGQNHLSSNRLRLWLRADRPFGLTAVPVTMQSDTTLQQLPVRQDAKAPLTHAAPAAPMARNSLSVNPSRSAADPAAAIEPPLLVPPPSVPNFDAPVLDREQKIIRLQQLDQNEVSGCTKCRLCETRTQTVF